MPRSIAPPSHGGPRTGPPSPFPIISPLVSPPERGSPRTAGGSGRPGEAVAPLETPVRVASVGTGRWAATLAEAAGRGTGLAMVACTSRSADHRAAFAGRHGCREAPTFDAVLTDTEVEAV